MYGRGMKQLIGLKFSLNSDFYKLQRSLLIPVRSRIPDNFIVSHSFWSIKYYSAKAQVKLKAFLTNVLLKKH